MTNLSWYHLSINLEWSPTFISIFLDYIQIDLFTLKPWFAEPWWTGQLGPNRAELVGLDRTKPDQRPIGMVRAVRTNLVQFKFFYFAAVMWVGNWY